MQEYPSSGDVGANEPGVYAPQEKRFPWGCLLGGCLGILLIMLIGAAVSGWALWSFYNAQLEKYTSPEPQNLPVVAASEEQIAEIEQRVEEFQAQVDNGNAPEQLILTADDINALISKEEKLRGKVFVKVEAGELSAEVSIPLDELPGGKGRYFNGSVTADVELRDGILIVTIADAEVNGTAVPEAIMEGMRKENLAKEMYKDPEFAKKLGRFESIVIDDNRIVLTLKEKKPDADDATSDSQSSDVPVEEETDATAPDITAPDITAPDASGAEVDANSAAEVEVLN